MANILGSGLQRMGPPGSSRRGTSRQARGLKRKGEMALSKAEAISKVPFFENFARADIANVEPYFSEYRFEKNEFLFWEGAPARRLYIIKSGRVRVLKSAASGKEMVLDVMAPGQVCGGETLFADTHRHSAQAVEPAVTYALSKEGYQEILSRYPALTEGIISYLGRKLMDAHDVIISLVSSKVETRIASLIVRLCENHGTATKDGILINIRLTRQDIADIVGTTVETSIRTMSKFRKKGLISTVSAPGGARPTRRSARLLVKDYDALVEMAKGRR